MNEGVMKMPYVVIDAGHGGYDNGAQYFGYKEKDITLRVATKVASRLRELGFDVTMIRESDEYVGNASARGRQIAALKPNFAISIHVNSSGGNGRATGAEFIVPLGEDSARFELKLKEEFSKLNKFRLIYSKISGGEIVERVVNADTLKYEEVYPDLRNYYGIIREAWNGGVSLDIIEMFYLDNEGDLYTFLNQEDAYVEAIVKSMAYAFNMDYRTGVETENTVTQDPYYRVVCGAFYDLNDAKQLQRLLKEQVTSDVWIQEVK